MPAKFASMPSLLSLSHSRPRPLAGAGAFSAPVLVWPKRRIVHLPAGTSHASRPSASIFAVEVDDLARRMITARRRRVAVAGLAVASGRLDRPPSTSKSGDRGTSPAAGDGQHGDVAVVAGHGLRLRQDALEVLRPCDARSRSRRPSASTASGLIHGPPLPFQPASLFMFTSRPSRLGLGDDVLEQLAPCGAHERRPARRARPGPPP